MVYWCLGAMVLRYFGALVVALYDFVIDVAAFLYFLYNVGPKILA